MGKPLRVLVIEDSEDDTLLVIRALQKGGYDPIYERVETRDAMHQALERETWDIIISDYKMPHFSGLAALKLYKEKGLNIPFILVSGTIGEEAAVAAMVSGAHDYVMKNNLPRLVPAIQRELKEAESRRERKRAEEDLKKSKILLDSVFSAIQDLVLIVDKDLRVLISNWKSPAYTGDIKSPGTPHCYEAFIHRDVPCEPCHALEVFATGKDVLTEYFNPLTERYSDIRAYPIFDNNNQVIMVAEHVRDITDRKRAEGALKESENKYRLLADNVSDVIFVLDMNLNYTYISPSVKILRGYEPEEVLKQPSIETLTPSSRDLAMRILSEIIELEKSEHGEIPISRTLQLEMMRKDGTAVWTEVKFSFIRDENQRLVGILGVTRDITERKREEEELRSYAAEISDLYNNAPCGYHSLGPDGTFLRMNDTELKWFGYTQDEIIGKKKFSDITTPESRQLFQ